MRSLIPGQRCSRAASPSPPVRPPVASTRARPPTYFRKIVGTLTFTVMASRLHRGLHAVLGLGRGLPGAKAAERVVVDQLGDRRMGPTHRTLRVPSKLDRGEVHLEAVEEQ